MTPVEVEVTAAARSFQTMKLEQLREEWRRRFGAPPALRSPHLLRHLLAWRVQAEALGGLDGRMVQTICTAGRSTGKPRQTVEPGARLAREWQGRLHEVEVVAGGYAYDGRRYRSLSAIARTITGARWNGPRFFGLRGKADDLA